jgi:hypothetical protein
MVVKALGKKKTVSKSAKKTMAVKSKIKSKK